MASLMPRGGVPEGARNTMMSSVEAEEAGERPMMMPSAWAVLVQT